MVAKTKMVAVRVPVDVFLLLRRIDAARSRNRRRPMGVGPLLLNLAKPGIDRLREEELPADLDFGERAE